MNQQNSIQDICSLSPLQSGMLYHWMLDRSSPTYFEQTFIRLRGSLDVPKLREAFAQLIARHDAFRTVFVYEDVDTPWQIVLSDTHPVVEYLDLSGAGHERLEEIALRDQQRGFDLAEAPPLRLTIIRWSAESFELMWSNHHIIMDGWCLSIVFGDLLRIYSGLCAGRSPRLEPAVPYRRYIAWYEQQDTLAAQRFWRDYLQGYENVEFFPRTNEVTVGNRRSSELGFEFDTGLTQALENVARSAGVTINTVMQALWAVVLQKYSGSEDVVFGYVTSGRSPEIEGIENVVGLCINTIPLRLKADRTTTFLSLLQSLHTGAAASMKWDYLPLAEIQNQSTPKRDLINHLFVFENFPIDNTLLGEKGRSELGIEIEDVYAHEQTNYDLTIILQKRETLCFKIQYSAALDPEAMQRLGKHLEVVARGVVAEPRIPIGRLGLATAEEVELVTKTFNQTSREFPQDQTVHGLFEVQVEADPARTALILEGAALSYGEFNRRANQVARNLRAQGVGPDCLVGILADRSFEMMVGIFAILKAGGAYLPLDSSYPDDRLRYMLEDSQARVVLTQSGYLSRCSRLTAGTIIDLTDPAAWQGNDGNLPGLAGPQSLAYVIYTSGTTGKPKGVMIEHRSVVNRLMWMQGRYPLNASDVILQKTPITFDVSVWELFWWSWVGARLCLLVPGGEKSPREILDSVERSRVTTLHFVPSMLTVFLNWLELSGSEETGRKLASLKRVFASGEALTPAQVNSFHRLVHPHAGTRIVNLYGPTEATVDASYFECDPEVNYNSIPIGYPIQNYCLYIVDSSGAPVPLGVSGELCIAGIGVARGYLNKPLLTAERFVPNPFLPGSKMYRTGDLARWQADGSVEYLGRMDHQVKIRGYRIELGEVEARVGTFPGVRDSRVLVRSDKSGSPALCAYLVSETSLDVQALRKHLLLELPEYMVPSYFVPLERIPVTANGKLDRNSLPDTLDTATVGLPVEPRTEQETVLWEVWSQVLGTPAIGVFDEFTHVGGDSIKAIQVSSRLRGKGYQLEVKDLVEGRTIAACAKRVRRSGAVSDQRVVEGEIPLTPTQRVFLQSWKGNPSHQSSVVVLRSAVRLNRDLLQAAVTALVSHHDALRVRYWRVGKSWSAWNSGASEVSVATFAVGRAPEALVVRKAGAQLQRQICLQTNQLLRVGIVKGRSQDCLVIALHHLAMDAVSWNVFLEDLIEAYGQCVRRENIVLPPKTASFQAWARFLVDYAKRPEVAATVNTLVNSAPAGPAGRSLLPHDRTLQPRVARWKVELDPQTTRVLLTDRNRQYGVGTNQLLLGAVASALGQVFGPGQFAVDIHGHGRDSVLSDLDLGRTMGWFATTRTVKVSWNPGEPFVEQIARIKESTDGTAGQGLLGMMARAAGASRSLVEFNYRGQFDGTLSAGGFTVDSGLSGTSFQSDQKRNFGYQLSVSGEVVDGQLKLEILAKGSRRLIRMAGQFRGVLETFLKGIAGGSTDEMGKTRESPNLERAIEIVDLKKSYGDLEVLKGVTLGIEAGKCYGILGPNGAGKTTLLEIVEGILVPESGTVSVLGSTRVDDRIRAQMGVQLQESNYIDNLTLDEIMVFFARMYQLKDPDYLALLDQVGLQEKRKTLYRTLSGGQKQRFSIALALVNDPKILFLDEPTTGLDPQNRQFIWELVQEFKTRNRTVVLTTHNMEEAEKLADQLVILDHGTIIAQGTPSELKGRISGKNSITVHFARTAEQGPLGALAGMSELKRLGSDLHWKFWVTDTVQFLSALFELSKRLDNAVEHISVDTVTLEDVFIYLTGRELRE